MRIVSLVPSATEVLFALGLGDEVVAVTHECDWPPEARDLPHATHDLLPPGLDAREIDAAVRQATEEQGSIYALDRDVLARVQPDLVVTQALCEVCAVAYDDVQEAVKELDPKPEVVALDPHTIGEALGDVRTIAQATERKDAAVDLVQAVADRIDRVRIAVREEERPRVAALEWLDPVFTGGHWVPQLIELAGGVDVLGHPGEPSEQSSWELLKAAQPEVVVVMPCGYDLDRALEEAYDVQDELEELGVQRIVAVDASAYFSRPSLRLVDGLELLAHVLHPERVPAPPEGRFADVAL